MKYLARISVAFWTVTLTSHSAVGEEVSSTSQPLKCETGPITRTYGDTPWLVYSCEDERSIVIVSAEESPAFPFYFMFSPQERGYRLSGEGTGRRDATNAAFEELQALSESDIAALVEQTQTH
jgi:hypothetical protein